MNLLGICGSLRASSFNRMALELARASLPEGVTMTVADLRAIPMYDGDLQAAGMPAEVLALAASIRKADGIVIATPEYNFSIPGMLKNAIDWASRVDNQPFAGKPAAILSASTGPVGGARVQYDLRKVLLFVNAMTMAKPEVFIGMAATKFDESGSCTDDATRKFVAAQMTAMKTWVERVQRMDAA